MDARFGRSARVAAPAAQDPRWALVAARDRAADGAFFYSVETTGVYCRPSCAARRPNPANVRFHASAAEAEAAGFRPCKRCKPDGAPLAERYAAKAAAACRLIEAAAEPPTLAELAKGAGLSVHHFHRVFRAATGVTPKDYAAAHRIRRVRDRLSTSDSVTEAIYDAGFNSSSRFYAKTDAMLGMTPTDYRAGGAGTEIRFAIAECSLGAILVARTDKGVCAIFLGDDREALVKELQDHFRNARLIAADGGFEALLAKVVGFIEAPKLGLDLPLDVRGTAFQQRVWRALQAIPAGTTASYTKIARAIGAPKAVRAVAGACAANPIALAIPCHRVIRSDGALSGYRGGVARKRVLLDREKG
jgi:AraC family transcriptional regulator of adaptative response/methylated-DNA-[protein]-cysteine methyltransferase